MDSRTRLYIDSAAQLLLDSVTHFDCARTRIEMAGELLAIVGERERAYKLHALCEKDNPDAADTAKVRAVLMQMMCELGEMTEQSCREACDEEMTRDYAAELGCVF